MNRIFLAVCLLCGIVLVSAHSGVCSVNKIGDMKHKGGKLGPYRALLIGIDTYQDSSINGTSSVKGVNSLADVLSNRYGFKTELLLNGNATKDAILTKIKETGSAAGKDGAVIVYFAGTGAFEASGNKGLWYAADSVADNPSSHLTNEEIQDTIRDLLTRDVLLISDASYGDTFFGSAHKLPEALDDNYYLGLYNKRSRWGFTSGNESSKKGSGSFTGKLVSALNTNTKPTYSVQELYESIKPSIRKGSKRPPRCRSLRNTGDQGGELVFVLTASASGKDAALTAGADKAGQGKKGDGRISDSSVSITSNVVGAAVTIDGVPVGNTPIKKYTIPPGTHKIVISKEGYQEIKKNVIVKRGAAIPLKLNLAKIEVKPTKGNFTLETDPATAEVTFIGKTIKYSPGMLLEEGTYKVDVSAQFFGKIQREFSIKANTDNTFKVSLEPMKSFVHKTLGKFYLVNPGTFTMGSSDDESMRNPNETQHKVTLTRRFYMQEREITVEQWRAFIKSSKYKTEAEAGEGASILVDYNWEKDTEYNWGIPGFKQADDHPVVCVSWNDTQAFIKWLNKKSRLTFRLPTEAEWEYACRAGTTTRFSFGNCITRKNSNFDGNAKWGDCPVGKSSKGTVKTGSYPANAWGLRDMHGNTMEWCQDWLGSYGSVDVTDPVGPASGTVKVARGGGWTSYAYNARSAKRFSKAPNESYSNIGFRVVVELK